MCATHRALYPANTPHDHRENQTESKLTTPKAGNRSCSRFDSSPRHNYEIEIKKRGAEFVRNEAVSQFRSILILSLSAFFFSRLISTGVRSSVKSSVAVGQFNIITIYRDEMFISVVLAVDSLKHALERHLRKQLST